jgi:hypothetical protein
MRFRMTRDQFAQAMQRPQRKPSLRETARLMALRARQAMVKGGLIVAKQKTQWLWGDGNGSGGQVFAHTRSEARSEVKKALGIKKGRMPVGVALIEAESFSTSAA